MWLALSRLNNNNKKSALEKNNNNEKLSYTYLNYRGHQFGFQRINNIDEKFILLIIISGEKIEKEKY